MKYEIWHAKPPILQRLITRGYKVFEGEDHDLNLIGIRSKNRTAGSFDDLFVCVYREDGVWIQETYQATCDPSAEQHISPTNDKGVAILKAGQYRGVWTLDLHGGVYRALCQRGAMVTVYRDNTGDSTSDHINEDTGWFGINGHRAHKTKLVDSTKYYSSGCQVLRHPADFARLIALCEMQEAKWGNSFTYTLLEEE
jgi:hypothetical protein